MIVCVGERHCVSVSVSVCIYVVECQTTVEETRAKSLAAYRYVNWGDTCLSACCCVRRDDSDYCVCLDHG